MGAKMQIMAWDAKRRMDIKMQKSIEALVAAKQQKAAESGLDSTGVSAFLTLAELQQAPLLILRVNRNNLIEESLTQVWMIMREMTGMFKARIQCRVDISELTWFCFLSCYRDRCLVVSK